MRAYLAMFSAGFRRQAAYRAALVGGLATNAFFGVVRTALFLALYRQHRRVGGLGTSDVVTYVWVLQALFGVIWVSWIWEQAERARSGTFAIELVRPGDLYLRLGAYELGRAANLMTVRATVPLLAAGLVWHLTLPTTPAGVGLLAASMLLAAVVAFQFRFLYGLVAFWTPDYRALFNLTFPLLWLAGGFVVPVQFFPAWLARLVRATPLDAMLTAPVQVAIGHHPAAALARQALWVAALVGVDRAALALAERKLVVHGG